MLRLPADFLNIDHDDPMSPNHRHRRPYPGRQWSDSFTVTDKARKRVLALRADEPEPDGLALWVEVVGADATEFVYDLYFQGPEHADPDDLVLDAGT